MWGYILLEQYSQSNYNFSFPSTNTMLILQVIQWQYWWWFWFTYFIVLYYFLFLRMISFNLLKFSPSIVTSFRAHGKWGDFIICVIPISWCLNILTNSNFILRMLEWQMESSLLTIRVRGKQWYWIYKVEIKEVINLFNTTKNVGHNYWVYSNNTGSSFSYFYLNSLKLHFNNQFLDSFWNNQYTSFSDNLVDSASSLRSVNKKLLIPEMVESSDVVFEQPLDWSQSWYSTPVQNINSETSFLSDDVFVYSSSEHMEPLNVPNLVNRVYLTSLNNVSSFFNKGYINFINRFQKININMFEANHFDLNTVSGSLSEEMRSGSHSHSHVYFVLKQKKAFFKKVIKGDYYNQYIDVFNNWSKVVDMKTWRALVLKDKKISSFLWQSRNKRLLRTNRILILPAQVNITVITNSFDVIHSWYIPGLGIKLDCVPGRSTHHNLHIQNIGFYYGQCAEICGRYHHHMPIRICAVHLNHFMLWWSHYGYPTFFNNNVDKFKYQPTTHTNFIF